MTIYRGLTLVYTNGNPISGLSDDTMFHDFGQGFFMGLPVPAIIMLLAFAVSWFILRKTPLGRKIYAVGGNEKVSFIAGIKIERVKSLFMQSPVSSALWQAQSSPHVSIRPSRLPPRL